MIQKTQEESITKVFTLVEVYVIVANTIHMLTYQLVWPLSMWHTVIMLETISCPVGTCTCKNLQRLTHCLRVVFFIDGVIRYEYIACMCVYIS